MAAADGAVGAATAEQHAGAGLARGRALHLRHGDQHRVVAGAQRGGQAWPRRVHSRPSARSTASGVAGALSAGRLPGGKAAAMASRSAKNTDIANMNGGSPTALERCTVSSALALSNRRTEKCAGMSCTAGILYVDGAWLSS